MLQQQVHFLTTVLLIIDALAVIAAGYGAFIFRWYEDGGRWTMDTEVFAGSILLVMFANNYMLGKFGLYGDRRPQSYAHLLWSIIKATAVSFGVLSVGIFLFQEKVYSRLFFGVFALLCFGLTALFRVLSQLYLDKVSHNDPYSRKILVVGNPARGRFVVDLLKLIFNSSFFIIQ